MKKIKIILFSLIVSLIVIGLWWFGFKNKTKIQDLPQTIGSFFPLSLNRQENNPNSSLDDTISKGEEGFDKTRLLFNEPIGSFTSKSIASTTLTFFTDKDLGNLYFWSSDTNQTTRLSNETILNTRDITVLIENNTAYVYIKYLNNSGNYQYKSFNIPTSSLVGDILDLNLQATNLPLNIGGIIDNNENLLLVSNNGSKLLVEVAEADLNNKVTALNLSTKSWIFNLTKNNSVVLNTKPSYVKDGFAFILKNKTNALDYLVVNQKGLTTLISPNEKNVLYSASSGKKINTYIYDLENNQTIKLPFDTLAEKCAWAMDSASIYCGLPINYPLASFPDDWYKGLVNFNDNIIGLNITNPQKFYTIFNLQNNKIDIEKIELSQDERKIFYQDKNTNNLWISELTF